MSDDNPQTPCQGGPADNTPDGIVVPIFSVLKLRVWVCFTKAHLNVVWDGNTLYNDTLSDFAEVGLPNSQKGDHLLTWSVVPGNVASYQVRSEVVQNDGIVYEHHVLQGGLRLVTRGITVEVQ